MSGESKYPDRNKVFVGGVPRDASEDSFRALFTKFGELTDCVIMKDKHTNESRGFGFVSYTTPEAVENVLKQSHELNGKKLDCKSATPRPDKRSSGDRGGGRRGGGRRGERGPPPRRGGGGGRRFDPYERDGDRGFRGGPDYDDYERRGPRRGGYRDAPDDYGYGSRRGGADFGGPPPPPPPRGGYGYESAPTTGYSKTPTGYDSYSQSNGYGASGFSGADRSGGGAAYSGTGYGTDTTGQNRYDYGTATGASGGRGYDTSGQGRGAYDYNTQAYGTNTQTGAGYPATGGYGATGAYGTGGYGYSAYGGR